MAMGRGRKGSGVELREGSIRVNFTWGGVRCRETLPMMKPTLANKKAAERIMDDLRRRIAAGTFIYAEFFPDSDRATDGTVETFGAFCDTYLSAMGLAPATQSQYKNELTRWKRRLGKNRAMAEIRHSWLAAEVGKVSFPSARMRNNSLIPLRGVFQLWVRDDPRARVNPMDGVENTTIQKKKPDPLERDEAEAVLADLRHRYDERIVAYFTFAFFTGMRPQEQIALRWDRVDWRRKRVLVNIVRTFKGGEKETKTSEARWVDLNSRAMAALEPMRKWTQLKDHGHVFENSVTSKPWHDERSQRDHYWKPALARLRIRPRPAYATRSTRATMMLMAGMNPAYCAAQLGHSKRVFWEVYADWIDAADKGRERAKDEVELARDPGEEEKAG